jgi:hypothetical protein
LHGVLPIVAGTVIRIQVERMPGDRAPADLWLWHTAPADTAFDLDLLWKTYLRRFDLEHTLPATQADAGAGRLRRSVHPNKANAGPG